MTVLERDYREIDGRYSKIVSVEMFEAVGEAYWPTFFAACDRLMAPGGAMAMQTITMPHRRFLATRRQYSWIHKYVFPGGLIPSWKRSTRLWPARRSGPSATRRSAGTTHARWPSGGSGSSRSRRRWRRSGSPTSSGRMWEFYLAYCEAGFATGALGDAQILLSRSSR